MTIGIGVTTRNRPEALAKTLAQIAKHIPPGAVVQVVDDASDSPSRGTDFYFEHNVGIARAKNKCIELLMEQGCTDLFLFDDDTYPVVDGWWKPYVDSPQPHLMYVFVDFANGQKLGDTEVVYDDGSHVAYSHARGCMLYIHADCIDRVGGFDTAFGKWGWEHINYSDRVHAAGLTTFAYMGVAGSAALFHSGDEHKQVATTVGGAERNRQMRRNTALYNQRRGSGGYWCDYSAGSADAVITSYFAGQPDPQRGECWPVNPGDLLPLSDSVLETSGLIVQILHDCFHGVTDSETYVPNGGLSPYWQRWIAIYEYLRSNTHLRNVWCVDATDVKMLRDPFPHMDPGTIYVGDEPKTIQTPWMQQQHPAGFLQQFFRSHRTQTLLNCGLVGGSRENVMEFIRAMLDLWVKNRGDVKFGRERSVGETEMGLFNYVCYSEQFRERISHGPHVNTVFKKYKDNGGAWWMHK